MSPPIFTSDTSRKIVKQESMKQFSSLQDGIYALGKAHMRFPPPLRSFPNTAFETVPMFVDWQCHNGPLSSLQGRSSGASSFHASLLRAIASETSQCNTTKLNQPRPNMAVPKQRRRACEQVLNCLDLPQSLSKMGVCGKSFFPAQAWPVRSLSGRLTECLIR